eukprot:Gb_28954 [translate_table: standard]
MGQILLFKGIGCCNFLGCMRKYLRHQRFQAGFPMNMKMALTNQHGTFSSSTKEKEMGIKGDVIRPGRALQLKPTQADHHPFDFCTFIESSPKQQVINFFRQVIYQIEVRRKILDFHLRVKNDMNTGFVIEVFYGDDSEGPEPLALGSCISCYGDAPLFPSIEDGGVLAGECVLDEFSDQSYVRCSLDAKARPGFIVTPLRHVDRMSELENEEIYYLWWVGVRALRNENLNFTRMILNHGCYRNLAHLHLKIWVDPEMHTSARERWPEARKQLWGRLERLADRLSKKRRVCVPTQKAGKGRNGAIH